MNRAADREVDGTVRHRTQPQPIPDICSQPFQIVNIVAVSPLDVDIGIIAAWVIAGLFLQKRFHLKMPIFSVGRNHKMQRVLR